MITDFPGGPVVKVPLQRSMGLILGQGSSTCHAVWPKKPKSVITNSDIVTQELLMPFLFIKGICSQGPWNKMWTEFHLHSKQSGRLHSSTILK